jgi:uncharacterized protein YbjT (DUF2867 family)
MTKRILVLGGTGMLGQPVVRCLTDNGHAVRVLVRSAEKAREMFGDSVDIVEGTATNIYDIRVAMSGCDAVHINLTQETELIATRHVVELADANLKRISFVSATTAREENRWFELVDVKMRAEGLLRNSGIPYVVFCPTWVMETLHNFVKDGRATAIIGKNPPEIHFFTAADFGRMVAASYDDERALGKRLFIHGPEGVPLPDAIERFVAACHPDLNLKRLQLWQARLIAKLSGRKPLAYVTRLIGYYDKVGELGDPTEANALYGAPATTLDAWFKMPGDARQGMPH